MGCTVSFYDPNDAEELPIYLRGVRLKVAIDILQELNAEHVAIAKQKLHRDPSPGEVIVHGVVKEKAAGMSLADYLWRNPSTSSLVGPCSVFLSHT